MTQTAHDAAVLAEAWRRAVLSLFVREHWLEQDAAASMLTWPHSGFSAQVGAAIAATDRAAVLRVARYGRARQWRLRGSPTTPSAPRWSWQWMTGDAKPHATTASDMTPGGFHAFEHQWATVAAFRFQESIGRRAWPDAFAN